MTFVEWRRTAHSFNGCLILCNRRCLAAEMVTTCVALPITAVPQASLDTSSLQLLSFLSPARCISFAALPLTCDPAKTNGEPDVRAVGMCALDAYAWPSDGRR